MTVQPITLQLPRPLYERFKQKADEAHRTVEAEVLDAVAQASTDTEGLPPDLSESLVQLTTLEDKTLWQLARSHLSRQESQELEDLHLKRQSEGVTPQENARTAFLVAQYERRMVLRAHAARVLNERGHEVSCLLREP